MKYSFFYYFTINLFICVTRTIYIYFYNAENNDRRNFYYNKMYELPLSDLKLIVRLCIHLFIFSFLFAYFFIILLFYYTLYVLLIL